MNTRFERNERYICSDVQLEHQVMALNDAKPTETYFLIINDEEMVMGPETFRRLCEICEAAKAHDSKG